MNMGDMAGAGGFNILPVGIDLAWMVLLAAVLVFHCVTLLRMLGQHRGYHLAHIAMIVGMIFMFGEMGYGITWIPAAFWITFYAITTALIVGWLVIRFVQRKPLSQLWLLALVQQAAMIYMFLPMADWVAWVSYVLAAYFLLEALGWLLGLASDDRPGRMFGPGDRSVVMPLGHPSFVGRVSLTVMAASMGYMFLGMQLLM